MNNVIVLIISNITRNFVGRLVHTLQSGPDVLWIKGIHSPNWELFQIILRKLEKQLFPGYDMEQRNSSTRAVFITAAAARERDAFYESSGMLLNLQNSLSGSSPPWRDERLDAQRQKPFEGQPGGFRLRPPWMAWSSVVRFGYQVTTLLLTKGDWPERQSYFFLEVQITFWKI